MSNPDHRLSGFLASESPRASEQCQQKLVNKIRQGAWAWFLVLAVACCGDIEKAAAGQDEDAFGELHSSGNWLGFVQDPKTAEFRGPYFENLADVIAERESRYAQHVFLPYPMEPRVFWRHKWGPHCKIAVIDSGVLIEHPLLRNKIVATIDVTGQGIKDDVGHGTFEAIRQLIFEPRADLIIVKAFTNGVTRGVTGGVTRASWLIQAFQKLREVPDLDCVFLAGGLNADARPETARLVCAEAERLVSEKNVVFIATCGNRPDVPVPCPAAASNVFAIIPVDARSQQPSPMTPIKRGITALGVPQTGKLASFPNITPLPLGSYYEHIARSLYELKSWNKAHDYAEFAVSEQKTKRTADDILFGSLYQLQQFEEAERVVRSMLTHHEGDEALNHVNLAELLKKTKRESEAYDHYRQAIQIEPRNGLYRALMAKLAFRLGKIPEAVVEGDTAAKIDSDQIETLAEIASELFYAGNYSNCLQFVELMITHDPTASHHLANRFACHLLNNDMALAKKDLEHYRELSSGFDLSFPPLVGVEVMHSALAEQDPIWRQTHLPFTVDPDSSYANQFVFMRDYIDRPLAEAKTKVTELHAENRRALVNGILAAVYRLRLAGRTDLLRKMSILAKGIEGELIKSSAPPDLAASFDQAIGNASQQVGDYKEASERFLRASKFLESVSARGREKMMTRSGFASLSMGATNIAEEKFADVVRTSMDFQASRSNPNVPTLASFQPAALGGQAWIAAKRGNLQPAKTFVNDILPESHDDNLVLLLAWRLGIAVNNETQKESDGLLAPLAGKAIREPLTAAEFFALLRDYPFLESSPQGQAVTSALTAAIKSWLPRSVGSFPIEGERKIAYEAIEFKRRLSAFSTNQVAARNEAPLIGIVGSNIDENDPVLKSRLINYRSLEKTNLNNVIEGSTVTAHELTAALDGKVNFAAVNVVDSQRGQAPMERLVYGLSWLRGQHVRLIVIDVGADFVSPQLRDTVRAISKGTKIIGFRRKGFEDIAFPSSKVEGIEIVDDPLAVKKFVR